MKKTETRSSRLFCFTDFSAGVNSVGKVSFRSTFSIKDRGQPSILVTSLSEGDDEEPKTFPYMKY